MGRLTTYLIEYLPRRSLSSFVKTVASLENRVFQKILINWFIKKYNVDLSELESHPQDYKTLEQFFIRRLKDGSRPISSNKVVAPVDGVITECGIYNNQLFKIKNESLSISELVNYEPFSSEFKSGFYSIHYLSPSDYHWIHSPVDGEIYRMERLRGDLYPVFDEMISRKKDILCINERYNMFIRNGDFKLCLSMIAAMGVGNIVLSDEIIKNNQSDGSIDLNKNPIRILKGDRLAVFQLGSTVALFFNKYEPDINLKGKYLKVGMGISKI